jgi:hypothetical protein
MNTDIPGPPQTIQARDATKADNAIGPNPRLDTASATSSGLNPTRLALLLCIGLLSAGCVPSQAIRDDSAASLSNPLLDTTYPADADHAFVSQPQTTTGKKSGKVDFGAERASRRTRDMANWVVRSRDNQNMPFAIVDKVNATVYVFSSDGKLHAAAPALLGIGKGDHAPLGVGNKPLSQIPVHERTTPAGRFASVMGRNHKGKNILWLDYEQALSLHAVVKGTPQDRRAERLASATPDDNRISFGCINVPTDFFKDMIEGKFTGAGGIVYVLPESRNAG